MEREAHPFVSFLERLREDRGALAALRRGLGKPPGTVQEMFKYVISWLPAEAGPRQEEAYFLVASLFAYHPQPGGAGNLGHCFFRARASGRVSDTAIERRFTALLSAHSDDLQFYLRQAVSLLKSKEIPIDWHQLFADIQAWNHPKGYVQKQWARAFWSASVKEED